jgi:hypothetical protein
MVYIYILELENNKYYVGKTTNPGFRLEQHFNNSGSQWTKKYKPIKILEILSNCDDYDEDKYTKMYMDKFGINNVRGGSYVQIKLNKVTITSLEKMNRGTTDKCFLCGKKGHFVKDCKEKCNDEHIWICDYCDKEFINENKCQSQENKCKLEYYDKLKIKFIDICKKYNKINNIMQASEIIDALKIMDKTFDFKLTNIYGFCQKINKCDSLKPIISYRDGINYIDFVDGLLYIINNDPVICDKCEQEECCCTKSKNIYKNKCSRCGRNGHHSDACYAKTNIDKEEISESSEEEIEVFCCSYCDKEFETAKGATCHENLYCKYKNVTSKKNVCYRCGRDGHYGNECYASKHINGKYLN